MLHRHSFSALRTLYKEATASPVEVVQSSLRHAQEIQPLLNAFAHLDPKGAIEAAKSSEQRWRSGAPLSPLDGMPVTVKEFANVKGWPTRRASLTTGQQAAAQSAVFVERLHKAGAILIGKTRAPEFNWKGTTDSPGFGITRNPLDPRLTPGGSSGGCAAAVAAGVVRLSFGSDAGGSVRIPASFCGILGLKPSLGKIPMTPFPSAFSELAHIGPLARDLSEMQEALAIVSGPTPEDWTSWRVPHRSRLKPFTQPETWRIAVLNRRHWHNADPVIVSSVEAFLDGVRRRGVDVSEVDFDLSAATKCGRDLYRLACHRLVQSLTEEQRRLIDPSLMDWVQPMSSFTLSDYFARMQERADLGASLNRTLENVDALVLPTTPVRAFPVDRNAPEGYDEGDWFSWNPYTPAFNFLHHPALSIPVSSADEGLPVGLQLVGKMYDDELLVKFARILS